MMDLFKKILLALCIIFCMARCTACNKQSIKIIDLSAKGSKKIDLSKLKLKWTKKTTALPFTNIADIDVVVTLDGKAYFGKDKLYQYGPEADQCQEIADNGYALREDAVALAHAGKIYIGLSFLFTFFSFQAKNPFPVIGESAQVQYKEIV